MSWECSSIYKTTQNNREGNMKKIIKTSISFFAVFALMITFSLQQVTAAEKIRWKVQSTFNTGWPALGDPVARLSDTLDRATDGRIKLKVYEPGKILPPLEISPSISKGDLPAAYNYMAYDQGRIPAAVLFAAVPFGMEPWEYAAWWFEGDGAKLANEIYNKQNIQVLLCSTIGPETAGWYRNPITSLADLKGLKIRFSGLGGMVLNEIGASATLMAGGEIFAALDVLTIHMLKEILVNLQHEKPNMCIVICEHQARELLSIVDRALILSNCKIIAEGSPNNLIKDENAKSQYFGNFFSN